MTKRARRNHSPAFKTKVAATAGFMNRGPLTASEYPKADGRLSTKNGLSASKFRALAPPLYRARVSRA